MPTLNMT